MDIERYTEELREVQKYLMNELVQRGSEHSHQALLPLFAAIGRLEHAVTRLDDLVTEERKP